MRDYDISLLWSDGTLSERVPVRTTSPERAVDLAARVVKQFGPAPEPGALVEDSEVRTR